MQLCWKWSYMRENLSISLSLALAHRPFVWFLSMILLDVCLGSDSQLSRTRVTSEDYPAKWISSEHFRSNCNEIEIMHLSTNLMVFTANILYIFCRFAMVIYETTEEVREFLATLKIFDKTCIRYQEIFQKQKGNAVLNLHTAAGFVCKFFMSPLQSGQGIYIFTLVCTSATPNFPDFFLNTLRYWIDLFFFVYRCIFMSYKSIGFCDCSLIFYGILVPL